MAKHLVIETCYMCPFIIEGGDEIDYSVRRRCGAIEGRPGVLSFEIGSIATPPDRCPLEDYDADQTKESVVKEHVSARATRYIEYRKHSKNRDHEE